MSVLDEAEEYRFADAPSPASFHKDWPLHPTYVRLEKEQEREEDYVDRSFRRSNVRPRLRDTGVTARQWERTFVMLGLDGLPVIMLVLAFSGVVWAIASITAGDVVHLFPSLYMALIFSFGFAVAQNIRKRFGARRTMLRRTRGSEQ